MIERNRILRRPSKASNFILKRSYLSLIKDYLKINLYMAITKKSSNLFLRSRDFISIRPNSTGLHEPKITKLIKHFNMAGYKDFLVDIGANVGLTSCQNGADFNVLFMFEPNLYCFKILEVNCMISLNNNEYYLYNYGLGDSRKKIKLSVPVNNWGGAYICDEVNSYSKAILDSKDGFSSFNKRNYFDVDIQIYETRKEMFKLFNKLIKRNLNAGVIKIDVEGYEFSVLKGIADVIPQEMKIAIIFESLDPNFDIKTILSFFSGRALAYKLQSNRKLRNNRNFFDYIDYFKLNLRDRLDINFDTNWSGDIVLLVD